MKDVPTHFLLLGNGPYTNRGCEAIVRGTMAILRKTFGPSITATVCSFGGYPELVEKQAKEEIDSSISHIALSYSRWSLDWLISHISMRAYPLLRTKWTKLRDPLRRATIALEIGGDNYSLDYGVPYAYLALDRQIWESGRHCVLWGASVGPFEAKPRVEKQIFQHLKRFRGLYVRESLSYDYLRKHGLSHNLHLVADPAFAMEAEFVSESRLGFSMPHEPVGMNFSGMMARRCTEGDVQALVERFSTVVASVANHLERSVLLIPHVASPIQRVDDHYFHSLVAERASRATKHTILSVPPILSAAETKGLISRCSVFAGLRTHSTIAAISSYVPTLSFAYSRKAVGLTQDIFGSQEYCLGPEQIEPEIVTTRLANMFEERAQIRSHLETRVTEMQTRAYKAGSLLRQALSDC